MYLKMEILKPTRTIAMIAAISQDYAIGKDGNQPVYIKEDLRHFKALTEGRTVVMGRRTQQALPKGYLPKRRNIMLSHGDVVPNEYVEIAHSVEEVMEMTRGDQEVVVIGGGMIYGLFWDLADVLYITHIDVVIGDADTYFPMIGDEWELVDESDRRIDEATGLAYRYCEYRRKCLNNKG